MPKKFDSILYSGLLEKNLLPKGSLDSLLKEADAHEQSLYQLLVKSGLVSEKDALGVLSEKLGLSYMALKDKAIGKSIIDKVPPRIATYYKFIPVEISGRLLTIAVNLPLDIKTQDEIRTQLGYDIEMVLTSTDDIIDGLKKYYGLPVETLEKIISQTPATAGRTNMSHEVIEEKVEDIEKLAEDAVVIQLVNRIIVDGWKKRATDIHIEPYRQGVSLRYRIDGLLYEANVPLDLRNFLNAIISRIKIMSNLNIVERRLPQDGRAVVKVQDNVLDLRISTIPTPFGESVVIRILPTQMLFSLEKLGLPKKDLQVFEKLIQKPHGIIFVTGPTGSGKTTTLYACLSRINTKERKIITIEDPIEYEMSGITQIQVMPEIGLDFARGLRSILRHDPDVIMVGEVRDLETAEIAIRVALTGHLVFSTIHTNDAASGIARLIDIGVEPYLVSSSVEAFIAQRLIRVVCTDCKYEDEHAPRELKELIAKDLGIKIAEVRIFRGKGCPACNFTGFFGRTAIYESLLIDEALKDLILKKVHSGQIKKVALARGMRTLRQDGWYKTISGITTPEEVMKVTSVEETADSAKGPSAALATTVDEAFFRPQPMEQRVYRRLDSKLNLRYKIFKSHEEAFKGKLSSEQLNVTKNVSAGGMLFSLDEPLPVGAVLEVKIELPNDEAPIECLARIVRVDEIEPGKNFEVAVCFLDITGADRTRLNNYLEEIV
ncbi:MAG: ATPase, T2SS/T4P/T4SS family [Candidatus Omnitrophota bacterium]